MRRKPLLFDKSLTSKHFETLVLLVIILIVIIINKTKQNKQVKAFTLIENT